jgi:carboxymethylenebutenolidase
MRSASEKESAMTVDRRIIDLYNEYVHTALARREFLARLAGCGRRGGRHPALALLEPNYAQARQIEPDDKRLKPRRSNSTAPTVP